MMSLRYDSLVLPALRYLLAYCLAFSYQFSENCEQTFMCTLSHCFPTGKLSLLGFLLPACEELNKLSMCLCILVSYWEALAEYTDNVLVQSLPSTPIGNLYP